MKYLLFTLLAIWMFPANINARKEYKPRIVVLTDIGDVNVEPDDMESVVHLLSLADMFEIEGMMTSTGWNCDQYPKGWEVYLDSVINAYGRDVRNLMARSGQKRFRSLAREGSRQEIGYWPSVDYIRSRTMPGSQRRGFRAVGDGNDSPGSEFLIRLADEPDDRPIYVGAWGGANTLAQAIWKVKNTRSAEQLRQFLHKFRVFTITDQDVDYGNLNARVFDISSHYWMRKEFQDDLIFIWDESTWHRYGDLGHTYWKEIESNIMTCGALGAAYPKYKYGVEGDTPSFLYVMPNGISDPEDPAQIGWGGVHEWGYSQDSVTYCWNSWKQPLYSANQKYIEKFYPDVINDFSARMQWARDGMGNRNPVVKVNGQHSVRPVHVKAKAGSEIRFDASGSTDEDGDAIDFLWWQQTDADPLPEPSQVVLSDLPVLTFRVPQQMTGMSCHIICEVHDNGPFRLVSYMRIIVDVV